MATFLKSVGERSSTAVTASFSVAVKPDIAVTRGAVTKAELEGTAVFAKLHMLGEYKTARGKPFHGQCAKYVERFGHPSAAYESSISREDVGVTHRPTLGNGKLC